MMKKSLVATFALSLMLTAVVSAAPESTITPLKPGAAAPTFTLKDASGKDQSLASALQGSKLVIVDFWSTKCPVSRGYEDRLKAIAQDYAGKGVKVVAVMSNQTEGVEDVKNYLEKTPLPYTVVIDPRSEIADRFGAQTTPHVFVVDPSGTIRYTGAIDNGSKEAADLKPHLREALDALLSGKEPPQESTRNFGCSIKRKA
jgi:peroxiredoxin